MKKICFFVTSLEPGGIETYLLRFLNNSGSQFQSVIICKSGKTGQLLPEYEQTGARIIPFKMGYFSANRWMKIYSLLKNEKFDAVCDFTGNFAGVPLWLAWLAGIKKRLAFYRHSSNHFKEGGFRSTYNRFVKGLVGKYSTKILSNSTTALDFFYKGWGAYGDKFEIIRNGIHSSFYKDALDRTAAREEFGLPINAYIIGHTGRYNIAKNHKTIVQVASKLKDRITNVHFVLAGRNTYNAELKAQIEQYSLQQHFTVLEHVKKVDRLLQSFDLYYFPSITEGQPNALLEAILVGVPIVASDIEPIIESTPDVLHQYLVPATDADKAAAVITDRYNNPNPAIDAQAKEWAVINYDAEQRFNQFLVNLI